MIAGNSMSGAPPSPGPQGKGGRERFLDDPDALPTDPLVEMASLHHQFESTHPFHDGKGRIVEVYRIHCMERTVLYAT
jgi:hypothetical protein